MPAGKRRRAFTIVEMLVVVGIIALLVGLVVPALSSARKRARKADELNSIRQVGLAWAIYANNNNDAALPGFLETDVQKRWDVDYEFHDGKKVPPAPTYSAGDDNIAGPWVWRLFYYLDYAHDIVHGYAGDDDTSPFATVEEADVLALQPAFGYNAYYIGGWWDPVDIVYEDDEGNQFTDEIARPRFWDARAVDNADRRLNVVSRSLGTIRRSSNVVTFASAVLHEPGVYQFDRFRNDVPGWHYIVPPILAEEPLWGQRVETHGGGNDTGGSGGGGYGNDNPNNPGPTGMQAKAKANPFQFEVLEALIGGETPVPLGRHNGKTALLFADGHTDAQHPGSLTDQQMWIDAATRRKWMHTEAK